jgi:D-alanyl-D-alanine carboxypeptidase
MPFNVTITMANEFGQRAGMEIYGIQILNEGSGFSVDDVVTAKAYTFVARKIKGIERKNSLRLEGRASGNPVQDGRPVGGSLIL